MLLVKVVIMVKCSNCNKEFDDDFDFCPYCGIIVSEKNMCLNCGFKSYEFSFCPKCGRKLIALSEERTISYKPKEAMKYMNKGISLFESGNYEESLECYDKAIKLDQIEGIYYFFKGNSLDKLKRYDEAIECCEKAIALDPNNSNEYYALKGQCLFLLSRYDEALECLDKVIELDPNYHSLPVIYKQKVVCLEKLGHHEEARKYYEYYNNLIK